MALTLFSFCWKNIERAAWELSDRILRPMIHKMEIWHYTPMTFTSVAVQAAKSHMPYPSDPARPRRQTREREIRKAGPEEFQAVDCLQHLQHTSLGWDSSLPTLMRLSGNVFFFLPNLRQLWEVKVKCKRWFLRTDWAHIHYYSTCLLRTHVLLGLPGDMAAI